MTLDDLRREHAERGIGNDLLALLERIVRSTSATYPAQYSDTGVWNDDSRADALQDWIATRLVGRGDLPVILLTAKSLDSFRAALTTSFRQFLVNRRGRSSASNLYSRTQHTLEGSDEFKLVGGRARSSAALWTLASNSSGDVSTLSQEDLVRVAWELSDDDLGVVRYGPYSLKSSPILRQSGLITFLLHLLGSAKGAVSLGQIAATMRLRFNLASLGTAELGDSLASDEPAPLAAIEAAELASSVLAQIGELSTKCLRSLRLAGGDFDQAARSAGVSKRQLETELSRVLSLIAQDAEDRDQAMEVYERLVESLFKE